MPAVSMTKVLIIEDDPIIASIYRSRLDKEGFQVEIAQDGQTGFYRIHEVRPDAVLLDLMLPKMDGIQILKKIRAQKQFQTMPVLVFTNAYLPNMVQEAVLAGATQVYNKAAITPKHIVDAFNQALFPSMTGVDPAGTGQPGAYPPAPAPAPAVAPAAPVSAPPLRYPKAGISFGAPVPPAPAPAPSRGGIHFPQPEPAKPAAPVASATPPAAGVDHDAEFQTQLMRSFLESTPETLNLLRRNLHDFLKGGDDTSRMSQLLELYRKVHALTGNAAIVGLQNIAQMGSALEAFLKELNDKPKNITLSTTRTLAHSMDFLGVLFEKGKGASLMDSPPAKILVVDDEVISRRAVVYALDKGQLKSEAVEDPTVALGLVEKNSYDLIVLDVDMPGMTGFELCSQLRAMPANQATPVVFVTGMTDFESRARSSLSGGNDLIAKPFLFIELTVKSLAFVMKYRIAKREGKG
jgi:DNA-binding response OmpR family regulator/HPt (histidine-containing phosphotransfer) domain-containing protein